MAVTHVKGVTPAPIDPGENLLTRLWERAEGTSQREAIRYLDGGNWRGMTWNQIGERIQAIGAGLIALGIEPGDWVALMSSTRFEWTLADLAILAVGAVTVPIYETSSPDQCGWILSDSGAKAAIAGMTDHAKSLDEAREHAPGLGEIFVIEDGGLDALAERGSDVQRDEVRERSRAISTEDRFSIIYTSGTTGNPKGCVLTHGNMLFAVRQGEINLQKMLESDDIVEFGDRLIDGRAIT